MNIKLKTEELKDVVNKVSKGMGNNKMLPITEMIGINILNSNIYFITTDGSSKVQGSLAIDNANDSCSFVVNGKNFVQLIQKTTTEFVELIIEDDKLLFKGNGNYSFTFPVDEESLKDENTWRTAERCQYI